MASIAVIEAVTRRRPAQRSRCFALLQGGQLWKSAYAAAGADPDEVMPADLQQLAGYMRARAASHAVVGIHQLVGLAGCITALPDACWTCRCGPGAVATWRRRWRAAARSRAAREGCHLDRAAGSRTIAKRLDLVGTITLPFRAARVLIVARCYDRGGVRRHAPVLEGPGCSPANCGTGSGTCQPRYAQRGGGTRQAQRTVGGYRVRGGVRALGVAGRMEPDHERPRAASREQSRGFALPHQPSL